MRRRPQPHLDKTNLTLFSEGGAVKYRVPPGEVCCMSVPSGSVVSGDAHRLT